MLKIYIQGEYRFRHIPYIGAGSASTSEIMVFQDHGLVSLGWATKKNGEFSWWSLADGMFYLLFMAFPLLFTRGMIIFIFDEYRKTFGYEGVLDNKYLEVSIFMICVIILSALPNLWGIYFNKRRFKYYIENRASNTKWGDKLKTSL